MKDKIKSSNIFGKSSPVLFGICAIVLAVVGNITFRDYGNGSWLCRTNWFWWRLLWFEAIFALFWFAIFGLPISRLLQNRHVTGATYAIVATICLRASIFSFVVWCVGSFVPTNNPFAVLPLAIQLLVVLYYGVISFMFPKTQTLQSDGMTKPQELGMPSPTELANQLDRLEHDIGLVTDSAAVKRLKEKVRYSLPNIGKITTCETYRQLVASVARMTDGSSADIVQSCKGAEELIRLTVEFCKQ